MRGISKTRAPQILAGAIVAETTMTTLNLGSVDICPWAVREGVICRRMAMTPLLVAEDLNDILQTRPEPCRPVVIESPGPPLTVH
jgi:exopolyphosphatase/guanosine-5'-triphosphate,3'-diphosphate pyrophosphatase